MWVEGIDASFGDGDSLCYVHVPAGGGGVQWDPALVVRLVDSGAVLHQEGHHVDVIVYAGLGEGGGGGEP